MFPSTNPSSAAKPPYTTVWYTPGDAVHGELLRQRKMRLVVFCHYKQAAGVLVNAVHDAGTHFAVDAGEPARAVVQQCVHQCAVRVSRPPGGPPFPWAY